jgi:hypothetical protein
MTTLNLLNSIVPTGSWNTDSIAPYNMQPYDYSEIAANVVLDSLNPILEITNIPVGAMIANPPTQTAPYDSSFMEIDGRDLLYFRIIDGIPVVEVIPSADNAAYYLYVITAPQNYNPETKNITATVSFYLDVDTVEVTYDIEIDLQLTYIQDGILNGDVNYSIDFGSNIFTDGPILLRPNEILSSYSVVSTDIANRKATIRVDKSIENLRPPLNRLFLNFDKTP